MLPARAPSARRTPNSRDRCDTENASSPWIPIPARRNAIIANAARMLTCTPRDAVFSATISAMLRTFEIGCSASAPWMIRRTAATNCAVGTDDRIARSLGA